MREGREVTLGMMLGAAVFVGKCLAAVHGTTPFHLMVGRPPAMLLPLVADESCANAGGSTVGADREVRGLPGASTRLPQRRRLAFLLLLAGAAVANLEKRTWLT